MTAEISVTGIVQGVGFRPFVARTAEKLGIGGYVVNSGGVVRIKACGEKSAIDRLIMEIKLNYPVGALVLDVDCIQVDDELFTNFVIGESDEGGDENILPLAVADLPVCGKCLQELHDLSDRRAFYPFISCVSCGPRYSILEKLPYDRENTTMADFCMCDECSEEYQNEGRRRHAQTISCHNCGPQLIFLLHEKEYIGNSAFKLAADVIMSEGIIAVKGIGGYHYVCSAMSDNAVKNLRMLKKRNKKAFAVMFRDSEEVGLYYSLSDDEIKLLESPARPILLVEGKSGKFSVGVYGDSRFSGIFTAYTPLHYMLCEKCGPLVVTSANISGEMIITDDEEMQAVKSEWLDGILYNKRRITTHLDDSVAAILNGKIQFMRRSRGYVPVPVKLNKNIRKPVLAMGGDLKSVFCLCKGSYAYISQYFGDMGSFQIEKEYEKNISRMAGIFGINYGTVICDLHPGYITSEIAERLCVENNSGIIKIQHHHAHAASVMAEHKIDSCIGVVFDGTGYGTDGAVWGGEFLVCRGTEFERKAHLSYVDICGGDEAAKNALQTAECYLYASGRPYISEYANIIRQAVKSKVNTRKFSSMGRLFDAVSAVLSVCGYNSYEGECAILLENSAYYAMKNRIEPYPLKFNLKEEPDTVCINQIKILGNIYDAYKNGAGKEAIALGFHIAVAEMVAEVCDIIRHQCGEQRVALSGGVFANRVLLEECVRRLEGCGFEVLFNNIVPPNDGGISLGQAWIGSMLL